MGKMIKTLPAEKGNATVVLDTVLYKEKILETLQVGKYIKLTKGLTESFDRKVKLALVVENVSSSLYNINSPSSKINFKLYKYCSITMSS